MQPVCSSVTRSALLLLLIASVSAASSVVEPSTGAVLASDDFAYPAPDFVTEPFDAAAAAPLAACKPCPGRKVAPGKCCRAARANNYFFPEGVRVNGHTYHYLDQATGIHYNFFPEGKLQASSAGAEQMFYYQLDGHLCNYHASGVRPYADGKAYYFESAGGRYFNFAPSGWQLVAGGDVFRYVSDGLFYEYFPAGLLLENGKLAFFNIGGQFHATWPAAAQATLEASTTDAEGETADEAAAPPSGIAIPYVVGSETYELAYYPAGKTVDGQVYYYEHAGYAFNYFKNAPRYQDGVAYYFSINGHFANYLPEGHKVGAATYHFQYDGRFFNWIPAGVEVDGTTYRYESEGVFYNFKHEGVEADGKTVYYEIAGQWYAAFADYARPAASVEASSSAQPAQPEQSETQRRMLAAPVAACKVEGTRCNNGGSQCCAGMYCPAATGGPNVCSKYNESSPPPPTPPTPPSPTPTPPPPPPSPKPSPSPKPKSNNGVGNG